MGNNNGGRSGSGGGQGNLNHNNHGNGQKKKRTNYSKEGYHKEEECLELQANAGKCKQGWKSVFDGMKNPHYYKLTEAGVK
jgi:hypothetical protein